MTDNTTQVNALFTGMSYGARVSARWLQQA